MSDKLLVIASAAHRAGLGWRWVRLLSWASAREAASLSHLSPSFQILWSSGHLGMSENEHLSMK